MDNYNYDPEQENKDSSNTEDGWKNPYDDIGSNRTSNNNSDGWKNPYSDHNQSNFSSNRPSTGTDGCAIASLVCGIIAMLAIVTVYFGIIFGVAAIVLAIVSKGRTGSKMQGMAIGGLVTGIIAIILVILIIIAVVYVISNPAFTEIINQAIYEYGTI